MFRIVRRSLVLFLVFSRGAFLVLSGGAFLVLSAGAGAAQDEDYVALWGPPVGAAIPMLDPVDATGKARSLEDLAGDKGLLLFFNRTTVW